MTGAQVRYLQAKESQRHDYEQEAIARQQNEELYRAHLAQEEISRAQIAAQERNVAAQTLAQVRVANINAGASRYATDKHWESSTYATETGAKTQVYVADQNAATQRYATDQNVATSRYSTDVNAATQVYRTEVESSDRAARLQFEQETQSFKNALEASRTQLAAMETAANVELKQAQVDKIAVDTQYQLEQLKLQAERLELDQDVAKYEKAVKATQAARNAVASGKDLSGAVDGLLKALGAII